MIHLVTDRRSGERDILTPVKHEPLQVRTLDGDSVLSLDPPGEGWTHRRLCETVREHEALTRDGADAYLGSEWIGSTEV